MHASCLFSLPKAAPKFNFNRNLKIRPILGHLGNGGEWRDISIWREGRYPSLIENPLGFSQICSLSPELRWEMGNKSIDRPPFPSDLDLDLSRAKKVCIFYECEPACCVLCASFDGRTSRPCCGPQHGRAGQIRVWLRPSIIMGFTYRNQTA